MAPPTGHRPPPGSAQRQPGRAKVNAQGVRPRGDTLGLIKHYVEKYNIYEIAINYYIVDFAI